MAESAPVTGFGLAPSAGWPVWPIGRVRSELSDLESAPLQGDEGAPDAWIDVAARFEPALHGLVPGTAIVVLTWLHLAARDTLQTSPRGDARRSALGVFATRSPARPNPIGLHVVRLEHMRRTELLVSGLEAINGTPVLDLKPVLLPLDRR